MRSTQVRSETAIGTPRARTVDMRLEVVIIPVSDVDRAKRFYGGLGWRLDADFAAGDDFRVIQFTPPGFKCSVIFGKNVTASSGYERAIGRLLRECSLGASRSGRAPARSTNSTSEGDSRCMRD